MAKTKYRNSYLASYGIDGYTVRLYQRISHDGIVGGLVRQVVTPNQHRGRAERKKAAKMGSTNQSETKLQHDFSDVTSVTPYKGKGTMIHDICMVCGDSECFSTKFGVFCNKCFEEEEKRWTTKE